LVTVSTRPESGSRMVLEIEVSPTEVDRHFATAYRHVAERTKVPGFRPGKAPRHVIDRFVGRASVLAEAVDHLVNESYDAALDQVSIVPIGPARGRPRQRSGGRGDAGQVHRHRGGPPGGEPGLLHGIPRSASSQRRSPMSRSRPSSPTCANSRAPCGRSTTVLRRRATSPPSSSPERSTGSRSRAARPIGSR